MTEAPPSAGRPMVWRTLLIVGFLDVLLTTIIGLFWVGLLALSDASVFVPLTVARVIASLVILHRLLGPVGDFARPSSVGAEVGEDALLEVDATLQLLPRHVAALSMVSWLVTAILALTLPATGLVPPHPLGRAEVLVAVLATATLMTSTPLFLGSGVTHTLHPVQLGISRQLVAHKLSPNRASRSRIRELTQLNVLTFTSVLLGTCSICVMLRVERIRAESLGEQLALAQISAAQLDALPLVGAEIVPFEALPEILGADPHTPAGETRSIFDPEDERVLAAVALGDGRWALTKAAPDEELGLTLAFIFVSFVLAGIPIVYHSRVVSHTVIDPIAELDAVARQVIEVGRLDEIPRIAPLRDDEVGALTWTFNRLVDTFNVLARAAKTVGEGDLRVELDNPGDLGDAFRAMLRHLYEMVENMRATTLELASAASELHAATEAQGAMATQQVAGVMSMTETSATLATSATQITAAAAAVLDNAEQTVTRASATLTQIRELDDQTRGIRGLLELIREIADRSDLLALNGSLEAVRAGEAGRGFALVAAEMRRLAERVGGTVEDIRARVDSIETATQATVFTTEHNRTLAEGTARSAREINDAIVIQSRQTEDAADVARQVASAVGAFERALDQTRATAEGLRVHAQQLEALTGQFQL